MAPAPDLPALIGTVERDAPSAAPLDLLATAASTASELDTVTDALLGHFVDRCRQAGRSWSEISTALGVSRQAAHKRFSAGPPTLDRWTERARNTLTAATAAAVSLGHDAIGTEHLLLGLFAEPRALAAVVLAEAGLDRAAVQATVLTASPRPAATSFEPPPYTPRAVNALRAALGEALALGHNYVGTEHLLLALFREPESRAATILAQLGLQHTAARHRLLDLVSAAAQRHSG